MEVALVINPDIRLAIGLSDGERNALEQYEAVIERGLRTFVDVGNALLEIRDRRLYRDVWGTFEDYCWERWGLKRQRAYELMGAADVVSNLSEISDILPARESHAAPMKQLSSAQQREVWTLAVETAPNGKVTGAHVQSVVDMLAGEIVEEAPRPHVSYNAGNNEWYTPPEYINAALAVLGAIDLDPASTAIANEIVGAQSYYTAEDDGLMYPWAGRLWMNPPYASELVWRFADKLVLHFLAGDVTEALVLVNNATETGWFQSMLDCASAVCFVKRRVRFLDPEGNPGAPLQGQAILYLGNRPGVFADAFREFGAVLYGREAGHYS